MITAHRSALRIPWNGTAGADRRWQLGVSFVGDQLRRKPSAGETQSDTMGGRASLMSLSASWPRSPKGHTRSSAWGSGLQSKKRHVLTSGSGAKVSVPNVRTPISPWRGPNPRPPADHPAPQLAGPRSRRHAPKRLADTAHVTRQHHRKNRQKFLDVQRPGTRGTKE